jgi:hypothetical protein
LLEKGINMKIWIAAIALMASAAPAMAYQGGALDSITERQFRLEQRMDEGLRSGELTRMEYRRLRYALNDIRRNEQFFLADGRLTAGERDVLQARLDTLSREIYRQKHDFDRRGEYYNGHYAGRRF